jgi:phosphate transport system substrate-binding protein
MSKKHNVTKYLIITVLIFLTLSCTKENKISNKDSFHLSIDGSSTVYPITSTIVESYKKEFDNISFSVNVTGTSEGLLKFSKNQILFCNASRKIHESEVQDCDKNGVQYHELIIGFDGIAVVVNKNNDWVSGLTTEQLRTIWSEENLKWSDIDGSWPAEKIEKLSPGTSSGTYDYFKEVILDSLAYSTDILKSENDNLLVKGVESSTYSIAFFGISYFEKNKTNIKAIPIKSNLEYVEPNPITIENGSYSPLSRPLYIYVNKEFTNQPIGNKFVNYYLSNSIKACQQNGTVPQSNAYLKSELARLNNL